MAGSNLSRVALILLLALNGCYRYRGVTLEPSEVTAMRMEKRSAHILYRNGDTRDIDGFDTVTVRARSADDRAATHEYGHDVSGEFDSFALRLANGRGQSTFARQDVSEVEIQKLAPGREWIITGAAVAGTLLGALIGRNAVGCSPDGDCEHAGYGALAGAVVGMGLGMGISIPLTYPLGTVTKAQH